MTNRPDPTDEQLVNAINTRDRDAAADAFAAIYRRHHGWVVSLAYRFTGDRELALDVMQDVFAYLLTRFPGFRLTAQLRTYLYPVVRSTAATHLRRRRTLGDDALQFLPGPPVPASSEHAALHAALASLSDAHREVLLMRIVDEMHTKEIAAALSIPPGTAKSRLHTALNLLRQNPALRASFDESPPS